MCTECIYKAEDGVSVLALPFSDYAGVNGSLEDLMQAVLALWTEGVKTPESSQPLMPLHSLAFPNYLAHLSVGSVHFFCLMRLLYL